MTNRILSLFAVLLLCGCAKSQPEASRFTNLELKVGMNRKQVEGLVSRLLGEEKPYSPYGNNLRGGTVQYRDGDWVLEVKYKAGAPAPWVKNPDGSMKHYPPIDETVLEYRIEKDPNKALERTSQ